MEQDKNSRRHNKDRISSLPDCLIHLIMSFLTAQDAIQTCVLSKRWKNLWTTLPFLNFDWSNFEYHYFEYNNESDDSELVVNEPQNKKIEKFINFVSMTLLLREATDLHYFSLSCDGMLIDQPEYHMFIRSWILYSIKHNLQVLNVDFGRQGTIGFSTLEVSLPLGVFTCASLVEASFHFYISVHNVKVINLPYLRRLSLKGMDLNQDFVDKLLYGCPVLEFLHLGLCITEFHTINSQSLKYLEVQCCCSDGDFIKTSQVKPTELINAPNLLSLCVSICVHLIGPKLLLKMPTLTTVSICIEWCSSDDVPTEGKSNILSGLSNVQDLKLSGRMIKDLLENELPNCPEFPNVKDLSMNDLCLSCHFNLLACFLNQCPNLKKLSLSCPGWTCKEKMHHNQESLKITPYNGKQLETVVVNFNRHDNNFPQIMTYLQDFTKKSRAQINMTSLKDWFCNSSEEDSQEIFNRLFDSLEEDSA
ncbi:FBD-associated F-box protein [Rhynchospora pubera]|uniref:FBD-associated F-box protein n=1 Tax=Rhynchospora pubera TaxID=906938 RepID=A0AAV8F4I2_9POAL|nr:FBD-associated F-box protein [Rhynchospora pubera]